MKFLFPFIFLILYVQVSLGQIRNKYLISFDNAAHHEATVNITFPNLPGNTVSLHMSRTSPGRYALHEFSKNIYNLKITNSKGKEVDVVKPNLHQWDIANHDGTVNVSYTLFANRGDGTYPIIDETHAIINNPATFMFSSDTEDRPIEITYQLREDLQWKIATQMRSAGGTIFLADNLQDFMDSPALLGNFTITQHEVTSGNEKYNIKFALQHNGTEEETDAFFDQIKKIVDVQKEVFGGYPSFDQNEYTFLASFMPQVARDGMEHRNSTVITNPKSIADGGMRDNISTFAHEFFHAWNVERIRPESLEPFDFSKANVSGELWFAEGFTSYYTGVTLCRAGIITLDEYISDITQTYNKVWTSAGLKNFNVIEMSKKAPFVDAAKTIDPVNKKNTFVSYYSYGNMLGLALDLSLRNYKDDLNLDDFMKLFWTKYGKTEIPYTLKKIQVTLQEYAGDSFANDFFENHIYNSQVPDFKKLLSLMGLTLISDRTPYIGAEVEFTKKGLARISEYTSQGTPAYEAGLEKEDLIISIDNKSFSDIEQYNEVVKKTIPGRKVEVKFKRHGVDRSTFVKIDETPFREIIRASKESEKAVSKRFKWLGVK
ncbi:M61 family metallopeptidase [Aquimarina pacifica]|uniref:M61 family metallopeptidase n=1 Tax=Aquimarina pacifica TaxID=1296415 RepID=UPI00046F53BD|nr:PDZ domain-containing protein [Aquimarina pacifica]